MVIAFDLDDTLYDELTYVESGFRAVAWWGAHHFGWDPDSALHTMREKLITEGRGAIFQALLPTRTLVRQAVQVYRHHQPSIVLWPEAARVLDALAPRQLYLVTDGHKVVQGNKIRALGLPSRFRHCYLTSRYGRDAAKPSLRCFELLCRRTGADWSELVYIGDNPAKDFVSLNRMGACTVRVHTGQHAAVEAPPSWDASIHLSSLGELPGAFPHWFQ